ncbi:serine hydrolase [Flavobacterium sp. '19STA2R22 D10 B1']|uniref:serine hydrolase n=1 Tax=Flavobacterium aerium TaxID=3037261 RepID=UPI00278C2A3F|nr:serine hydrolase [Flavobacterium sp. '19STA2R22 D10 B1']
MKKTALFFLLFLHFYSQAQTIPTDNPLQSELDQFVQKAALLYMKDNGNTALSIGIIKDNIAYTYNYGTTKYGEQILPTNHTAYEIGSISKTFAGTLVALALKDKKINLKDDIRKYLDQKYPNLEYNGQPIRIEHLVSHTSGLPKFIPNIDLNNKSEDSVIAQIIASSKNYSTDVFLKDLHQIKINSLPGTQYNYSNAATELMGIILEKVYHKSYTKLLKDYITVPLKMINTEINPNRNNPNLIAGYNSNFKIMPPIPSNVIAAGGIYATTTDMLQYLKFHLNEKNDIAHLSHQVTWRDSESFALGLYWRINTTSEGVQKLSHSGGTFGYSSYGVIYPELNIGIIMLTNCSGASSQNDLENTAEKIFNNLYYTPTELAAEDFELPRNIKKLRIQLLQRGFNQAIAVAEDLNSQKNKLSEGELNNWGYTLLRSNKKTEALEIFKLNVHLFPKSGNTYDSLAETYENLKNKELALQNYKRSLELDPANSNAVERIKKLEQK